MEHITFTYERGDDFSDNFSTQRIENTLADKDDCGLTIEEVCEQFMSFMESVGFSVDQIVNHFQ